MLAIIAESALQLQGLWKVAGANIRGAVVWKHALHALVKIDVQGGEHFRQHGLVANEGD